MNIRIEARARCYAKALVQKIDKQGGSPEDIESAMHGLQYFWDTYQESQLLREVLSNPRLRGQRRALLQTIFARLAAPLVAMYVTDILANRHALVLLPQVVAALQHIIDMRLGRLRAIVTCAEPLDSQQTVRLTQALQQQLKKPVVLEVTQDQHLLGGIICRIGNMVFDGSLKGQLTRLSDQLTTHLAPIHTR